LDKKEKVIGVDRIEGLVGEDDDESEVDVDSVLENVAVLADADLADNADSDNRAANEKKSDEE
jgi:hypothetical protein